MKGWVIRATRTVFLITRLKSFFFVVAFAFLVVIPEGDLLLALPSLKIQAKPKPHHRPTNERMGY
jgi:hypothetical protein